MKKYTILVTNDDGITSEGLRSLVKILNSIARVYIVAPDREKSGSSHSMALSHPLRVNVINKYTASIDGTPTDCVKFGVLEFLKGKKIDLIVSGINIGENMGCDVSYSGTVNAAFEGLILGIPSISISIVRKDKFDFSSIEKFIKNVVLLIFKNGISSDTILNINIPNVSKDSIKGIKFTKLGKRIYNDVMIKKIDPRGKPYYWIGGTEHTWVGDKETDFFTVNNNMISITPLHLDMTNYRVLRKFKKWNMKVT